MLLLWYGFLPLKKTMAAVDLVKDVPGLTEEERSQLFSVMMKAKELDAQEENKMRQPLEGVLLKYTNVVKGWQLRWFILSPETGYLDYYMPDEIKKHKPRGAVHLAGAVVSPSDEDSQTFSVSAVCGEVYKLRANDAKERQFWVNRLRAVAEHHTQFIADKNPPLPPRDHRLTDGPALTSRALPYLHYPLEQSSNIWSSSQLTISGTPKSSSSVVTPADNIPLSINNAASVTEAFCSVKEMLRKTELNHQNLVKSVESLPLNGKQINCCHPDLLLLKATSNATVACLEQCYTILQQQQVAANYPSGIPEGARVEWVQDGNKSGRSNLSTPDIGVKSNKAKRSPSNPESSVSDSPVLGKKCDPSGELTDEEENCIEYADFDDKAKGSLLQLIGQLKLGMDLNKINLPAFILEPRSLLEVYSDLLSNLTILFSVCDLNTAEERMVAILKWYLISIHFFQMSSVARKPYNPIIGETFHCSWRVPKDPHNEPNLDSFHRITYIGEQVSHDPPVTAIFAECEEKKLSCEASIQVKPKFFGMYATVNLIGDVIIRINETGEKYIFTLPILHVRSLLSNPWIEFGGRVTIHCPESKLTSYVTFHTKPFYGGKPHKISAESKVQSDTLCRVTGEWDEILQFHYQDGSTEEIDVRKIKRFPKRVRPTKDQDAMESRRLWHNVSAALRRGNNEEAEEEKQVLESHQRDKCKKLQDEEYKGKLFCKRNDVWEYKYILRSTEN